MAELDLAPTNVATFTVTELSNSLRRVVEDRFGYVRVRGEISGYRGPHSSGHAYFCLKDANARLDAVVWRTSLTRMSVKPEEGLEVVATGRLTTFPGKSSYQIVVDRLELAGLGALMALLDARRRKLAEEGLFDAARKRKLPFLPRVVGVVTSPTGAVIRDILHRLSDRFPVRVMIWPVRVQGESSASEVAAAIDGFNALPVGGPISRPDVLIVARGGGSLEDLWGFNEETVVRAAAPSAVPLIAAVGHETDWTLLDHVADLRAPTPTAAAEFAVPVRAELMVSLSELDSRSRSAIFHNFQRKRAELRGLSRSFPSGEQLIEGRRQRVDQGGQLLLGRLQSSFDAKALRMASLARTLARHSPQAHLAGLRERVRGLIRRHERLRPTLIERKRSAVDSTGKALAREADLLAQRRMEMAETLAGLMDRMRRCFNDRLRSQRSQLTAAAQLLEAVSYRGVLARGFALIRDEGDKPIRRAEELRETQPVVIEFADGDVAAIVNGRAPSRRARRTRIRLTEGQGSLF